MVAIVNVLIIVFPIIVTGGNIAREGETGISNGALSSSDMLGYVNAFSRQPLLSLPGGMFCMHEEVVNVVQLNCECFSVLVLHVVFAPEISLGLKSSKIMDIYLICLRSEFILEISFLLDNFFSSIRKKFVSFICDKFFIYSFSFLFLKIIVFNFHNILLPRIFKI